MAPIANGQIDSVKRHKKIILPNDFDLNKLHNIYYILSFKYNFIFLGQFVRGKKYFII